MGDRRIVLLHFPEEYGADIGVYTLWRGATLEDDVKHAQASAAFQSRLGDVSSAARIMIDQLTKWDRDEGEGWGVFPVLRGEDPRRFAETEYSIVHVDVKTGLVWVGEMEGV